MLNKILVIDDKENICKLLRAHLSGEGYQVETAENGEQGLELFAAGLHDLVITDVKMPGIDGLEVLRRVKELSQDAVVLLITAFADMDDAIAAMKMGAFDYLKKPFKLEELQASVEKALENRRLVTENRLLRGEIEKKYRYDNIISKSKLMRDIFIKISRVAVASTTVLVTGETGTGKELVAKAIHYNSARKKAPFVVVNCGAIPVNLIESELFGHVRGAFTDAIATRPGKFEEADGGTIFLDEIGELDISVQGKLLRVLQEGEIARVGDSKAKKVDVRVVCATNKNLDEEVAAGNFRKDLFYRINVVPIILPPLRSRPEDIPLLLRHYLDLYCSENNRRKLEYSPKAMSMLLNHNWPGNVRELMNITERCVLMAEGGEIETSDLPAEIATAPAGAPCVCQTSQDGEETITVSLDSGDYSLKKVMDAIVAGIEKQMIIRALAASGDSKEQAAKRLGISRRTMFYKLKEYGL